MAYWYAHLGFLILLTSPLPVRSDPDVPVGVALMDQNPVLVEGYDAELSCRFRGTPRAVSYHKDVVGIGILITWYDHIGLGYESGKYDITDEYSLVIHEVTASDAGRYYCRVSDSRGITIGNDTDATVQTAPRAPFPSIDQCPTTNESPCSCYVNHSDDAVILTCRAEGASRGLVSLLWSRSGNSEGFQQQNRISANQEGRTETVEATIEVQSSSDLYVCTAIVHATRFENRTASVTVWVPISTTSMTTTTATTAAVLPPTPPNTSRQTIIAVLLPVVVIIIVIIVVVYVKRKTSKSLKCHNFRRLFTAVAENPDTMEKGVVDQVSTPCPLSREPYTAVAENPETMETQGEPLSYIELWWLCNKVPDLFALAAATRKMRRQPDVTHSREKHMQRTLSNRELYGALCAWKEGMEAEGKELRQRHQLYEALKEQKMNKQVTRLEEFRTSKEEISDDDLEHICWSVRELPERVNPVLKALGLKKQHFTDIDAPAWPTPPRQLEWRAAIEEDMQPLLKWRVVASGANKMYTDENIGSSERVVFAEIHNGGESSLPLMGVHESTDGEGLNGRSNQRVAMCLALEQVGEADPRYRQVAKTFSIHALREPLSYIELWRLCNKVPDLFALAAATRKLRRQPDETHSREERMQKTPSQRELYGALCAWKEGMEAGGKELRQRHQLYEALREQKMNKQVTRLEEFRTSTEEISDDDLEHICWSVSELPERVNPVLKALGFKKQSYTDINPPACPKPPRQQERRAAVEEDMQSLLKWRVVAETHYGGEESTDGEGLKGRSNQRVAMCRALEQAGKTDPRYRQVAETFSLHALREPLSYIELWWLCKTVPDLFALAAATRKLRRQPDVTHSREKRMERTIFHRELYGALCAWKEGIEAEGKELRQRHQLYEALREQKMNQQVTRLEEFRTSTEEISDDDLEHICWNVRELPERVNPVLKALGFKKQSYTDINPPAWPKPPRQQERRAAVEDDMQSLLKWRVVAETHYGGEKSTDGEGLKGRSNQHVAMCRALEQAGKTNPCYRQVAKTFSIHALREPLSYIELWWLCNKVPDLFALAAATRKLRRQPDVTHSREKRMQKTPSHRELYGALCAWKEGMEAEGKELRQRHQLYEALREQKMDKQVTRLKEFRTSTEEISDDDLEYICWNVRELPERVNPVLKALGFKKQSYTDINPPAWPKPPRQQERRAAVEEDMQSLLKWRVVAETHYGGEESTDREGLKGRSNQRVAMCRALEQASKTNSRYGQVAKTFSLHALNDDSRKRNPTEEEVKFLAIAINRRQYLKLNEKVKLSPGKCKALAKENLDVLFRSRDMLEDWLREQMCSSYEVRCRLRAAAEQAGRKDIADMVIKKESIIDPSKPAQSSIDQKCSTDKTEQPVSYITLEELRWIWRLAGKEAVQKVCRRYKITAEAESAEHGKEADDDLLKELQSRLNTEYVSMQKKGFSSYIKEMDPRRVVRKLLKEVHPSYASLMPKVVKQMFIFDVEITELALRIALRDIYDFAEALGISMGRLTNYKPIFQQGNEGKGTFAIVFELVEQLAKEEKKNTRKELCEHLEGLGYRQEARMILFGDSVGIGDMIAVAKDTMDTSALLRELGVSVSGSNPDVQANPDAQSKPDFQTTVDALRGWRGAIHPPSFNHRTALVEALYRMDNKPLALEILSGKHRKVAMTREMAAQLARDIPEDDDHMNRLCKALKLKERKGMELPSNPEDAIMAWAADGKRRWKWEDGEKKFLERSNSLLRAGFFEVAYEIMAGVRKQQGGNK